MASCLNCGARIVGAFCHDCGQASNVERYSLASFARELYKNARQIDLSATIATSIELLRRPGDFVREYLAGRRVRYINPVKFFFYSLVTDVFVRGTLHWFSGEPMYTSILTADTRFQFAALLSTVFWGVAWRLFYRKSGFNLVECIVCGLFLESQSNLFSSMTMVITFPLRNDIPNFTAWLAAFDILTTLIFGIILARQLFHEKTFITIAKQMILLILFLSLLLLEVRIRG